MTNLNQIITQTRTLLKKREFEIPDGLRTALRRTNRKVLVIDYFDGRRTTDDKFKLTIRSARTKKGDGSDGRTTRNRYWIARMSLDDREERYLLQTTDLGDLKEDILEIENTALQYDGNY